MMVDPAAMLGVAKASEVVFEALPQSVILTVSMLSSNFDDLSFIKYFSSISSFLATGLLLTEANFGLAQTFFDVAPKNPCNNWLPTGKKELRMCFGGYFLFTMAYCMSNVLVFSLFYLKFGPSTILHGILTELAVVMLFKHFVDGELFAFSMIYEPSKVDYVLGPLSKFAYYMVSFVGYLCISKNPCELGPHVTMSLIIWRMMTGSALVVYTLPGLIDDGALPWLSQESGMTLYFSCLVLSWIGAAIFFTSMADGHERWRMWRRQTGEQHIQECWDDKEIWGASCETKEENIANWLILINPLFLPIGRVKSWICYELVPKYGLTTNSEKRDGGDKDANDDPPPPRGGHEASTRGG
jgi:hypothetical protein